MRPGHSGPDCWEIELSGRVYQRLLAAYPKTHRRDYGPLMAQLFRDQCRDAWRAGRGWGLAWLWVRIVPDLVKTSVLEHLSSLKERKTMLERLGRLCRPRSAPWIVFAAVFAIVFFLVVTTSTLITFILPETYASTARLVVRRAVGEGAQKSGSQASFGPYDPYFVQTELEVIRSDEVLDKVIDELGLNAAWGRKYANGEALRTPETLALLRARLDVRPVRNTSLIEIRVFSDEASEAARLANGIAESYRQFSSQLSGTANGEGPERTKVEIIDKAVPGFRPVRPNKPLDISIGIAAGMLVGLSAGAAMAVFVAWLGRRSSRNGAPPAPGARVNVC